MRQEEIKRLLPGIFQRTFHEGSRITALAGVMEHLHAPSEEILENLDRYFSPRITRDDFAPFLARWVDLDWLMVEHPDDLLPEDFIPLSSGTAHLRELIASAAHLSRWRGTSAGLIEFLETATGVAGYEIVEGTTAAGEVKPFHILVRAPEEARPHTAMVDRIVAAQKPAYVTYEVVVGEPAPAAETREEADG